MDDLSVIDYAIMELVGGDEGIWESLIPARPMLETPEASVMGLAERYEEVVE